MKKYFSVIVVLLNMNFQVQAATFFFENKTGNRIGIQVKSNKRNWAGGILEGGRAKVIAIENECIEEINVGTDEDFKKTAWSGKKCSDHTFEITRDMYGYYQAK